MNYTDSPSAQEVARVKSYVGKIVVAVLLGIIGLGLLFSIKSVDAGEVAVVTRFGAVTGRVLYPGVNTIVPFIEGVKYINTKFMLYETMKPEDVKNSKTDYKDGPVDTTTKDGQPVDVYYTITFSIDPTQSTWVINKFGGESALVDKIIRAQTRSIARTLPANFSAEELYVGVGRNKVAKEIFNEIQPIFSRNGIILDSVLVRELGWDPSYVKAISEKQMASVQIDTEANKALQAKYQKEARITQAEGQAKEQELQKLTLTPQLLQKLWIEAWEKGGSQVPQIITSDNAGMFLNVAR